MRVNPINLDNPINRAKGAPVVATPVRAFADQLEMMAGLTGQTTVRGQSGPHPGPLQSALRFSANAPFGAVGEGELPRRDLLPLVPAPVKLAPLDQTDFVPGTRKAVENEHDRIAATARKWLAQTFYGTMLKQMRNSPFKSELFEGGRGGEVFATMLDQHLADSMAKSTDQTLVASIARKLSARGNTPAAERRQKGARNASLGNDNDPRRQSPDGATEASPENELNPFKDVKIHVAPNLRS